MVPWAIRSDSGGLVCDRDACNVGGKRKMIMKKKTLRLTLLFLILFTMFMPSMAFASEDNAQRVFDDVGLLTSEQAAALDAKLGKISVDHDFDVVVAVVDSLDGWTAHKYAAEVFEYFDFGRGSEKSGAILLISMEDRDFGFATTGGYGEYVFSYPDGQYYLDTFYLPYLKNNKYNEAFNAFADAADDFLTQAEAGKPYSAGSIPKSSEEKRQIYAICIIVSLVIGLIVALVLKAQLKSVRKDAYARAYIREGSMNLRKQHDKFLYSSVSKTERNNNSSGGGGGGSFSSSSGGSFSGHSGKF